MPCGAILYFDMETETAIRRLWQVIEDAGLPSMMPSLNYPPHLTLAACEDMDFPALRKHMASFVATHPPMPVQFSGLGFLHGRIPVITLAITANQELLDFYSSFSEMAKSYMQIQSAYYHPGSWIPHVTLDQEFPLETTGAIINALIRHPLPKTGLLRELVLVDFTSDQPGLVELFKTRLGRYL